MARIRIDRSEAIKKRLPPVCMKCGVRTDNYVLRRFSWSPEWLLVLLLVGLLPFLLVAWFVTKRMTVEAPMCEEHQDHWKNRSRKTWIGFFAVIGIGIFFLFLYSAQAGDISGGFLVFLFGIFFIGWLAYAAILAQSAIRPVEITEDDITLGKLSPEFVEALEDDRDGYERRVRERRRQQREGSREDRA